MADGWIRLHRQLAEHDLWKAEPFTHGQAWVDLLIMANWAPGFKVIRGIRIDLDRGQLAASFRFLADRWQWSKGKVERFLSQLETDEQIGTQNNNVSQIITITNYDSYQTDEDTEQTGTQNSKKRGHRRDADGTQKSKTDQKTGTQNYVATSVDETTSAVAAVVSGDADGTQTKKLSQKTLINGDAESEKTGQIKEETNTRSKEPKKEQERPAAAASVQVPENLNTPEFITARDDWFAQRRRNRLSLRPEYVERAYERLLPLGPSDAAACLRYSTDNDYEGIFPERFKHGHKSSHNRVGPGQVHTPGAKRVNDF
jgi:hypothetical protein